MESNFLKKLAPILETYDKVSKMTASLMIPEFKNIIETTRAYDMHINSSHFISDNHSFVKLGEPKWISYFNNQTDELIKLCNENRNIKIDDLLRTAKFPDFKTPLVNNFFVNNDFSYITNQLNHSLPTKNIFSKSEEITFLDIKISDIKSEIKILESEKFESSEKLYTQKNLDDFVKRLEFQFPLSDVFNYDYFNFFENYEDYADWKRKKKIHLENLLKKFIKIKLNIFKIVRLYNINRRENFRKICSFFFKNLDDTDSTALISFAY